jgi:putative (di)nucleoside polyphosphate hydrolase
MPTRFFRAGVGTVIYNSDGQIAIFKRAQPPIGIWELQQGGIDLNESPKRTLWRELHEEVGIIQDDIEEITQMPGWTVYQRSEPLEDSSDMLGQAHCWFFLKLKPDRVIDLEKSLEDEAAEFKWTDFEELISITGDHKRHVYRQLCNFFQNEILKTPR